MAQVVVDSSVMRDKAKTIENASVTIDSLYAEMLQEVTITANKMKGTTIETQKKNFASMQSAFDTIVKDIKAYSTFLTEAAESYEAAEKLLAKIGYAKNDLKNKQKLEEIRTKLAEINLKEVKYNEFNKYLDYNLLN